MKKVFLCSVASVFVLALAAGPVTYAQADTIELRGASQFDEEHAFTRTMRKFEELVQEYYDGDYELEFVMHLHSELGLERDYFEYMSQGTTVDYAVVAPAHTSGFSDMAPFMDMPFLFRDLDHWNAVLDSDAFDPLVEDVLETANVRLIGFAGGGTRNLIVDRPVETLEDLEDLEIRVMGAPIQTRIFEAIQAAPSVIAYEEVYNAIQTGVINAAENEAAGLQQMNFYEVAPHISQTEHAITVRPLAFSNSTFEMLPEDLQEAILRAGDEAGRYGREIESTEDSERLQSLVDDGLIELHEFQDRDMLLEMTEDVRRAYAEELGAEEILEAVMSIE